MHVSALAFNLTTVNITALLFSSKETKPLYSILFRLYSTNNLFLIDNHTLKIGNKNTTLIKMDDELNVFKVTNIDTRTTKIEFTLVPLLSTFSTTFTILI